MKGFKRYANGKFAPVMLKAIETGLGDGLHALEVKTGGSKYQIISTNDTHEIKTTPGILKAIYVFDAGTAWTIDIKDGATSLTGGAFAISSLAVYNKYDIAMATNITIVTAGTTPGHLLLIYEQFKGFKNDKATRSDEESLKCLNVLLVKAIMNAIGVFLLLPKMTIL